MSIQPILQSEASECGLACLAMIGAHHGNHHSLRELRARFGTSLNGVSLRRMIEVGGLLGLQARPLRLDLDHLGQLVLPCVLHWDLNHFVVLERVGHKRVRIVDPGLGRRTLDLAEVSRHFTGVALELTPTQDFRARPKPPSISFRQLSGKISGFRRSLAMLFAFSIALQLLVLLAPFLMQWIVDQVLVSGDRDLLSVLGLAFGGALLLQVAIGLARGWAVVHLATRLGLQWSANIFSHLLRLPLSFFEKRHVGDVVSRMDSVATIQRTLSTTFVESVIDGVMTLVTLALMLLYSWKLALVTLVAVVLYAALRALSYRRLREGSERRLIAAAKQQSHLLESIRGMQSIKVAGSSASRRSVYLNLMQDTANRDVWLWQNEVIFSGASHLVFGLERIAVIWIGALLAMDSVFSVGMLIAYLSYKDEFATRISSLIDKGVELRMLRLHGERLGDIALAEPEREPDHHPPLPGDTSLLVDGLGFRYAEGEPWILKHCNFRVAPGESIAIVGASGCGKTTLMKVLLGLLEPEEGKVLIGGIDLQRLGAAHFRRMVGVVMQEDQLFAGTLAENIVFDDDVLDMDRIEQAARLAAIHDEILAMPMGYHTLIGDMGTTLSGGQKQRVILARALYRQPRLLFLDEATSHLDTHGEQLVNAAIRELQLTRIIIAHRPETIASADRILVMHQGRIVQDIDNRGAASAYVASDASEAVT